jgi:serine/threonine-protein kinase
MALEHVVGVDLRTLLRTVSAPLPPGLCALVGHDLCRALAYAYGVTDEHGRALAIVHRDVSPSNVMLSYVGQVRLVDFGIAKALGAAGHRSRTGTLKGKIAYLAPEVLDGAPFDHRADLFAVGVVMWEMLTGRRLFKSRDELQLMAEVRACNVPPPSTVNGDIPPALERVVMRALAREPEHRYQHANEICVELAPLLFDLRWGADETAAFLREAVPPVSESIESGPSTAPAEDGDEAGAPVERPTAFDRPSARRRAARRALLLPLGAALVSLVVISIVLFARSRRGDAPVAQAASPPAVAPVAAPFVVAPVGAPVPTSAAPMPQPAAPAVPVAAHDDVRADDASRRPTRRSTRVVKRRPRFDLERGDVLDSLE